VQVPQLDQFGNNWSHFLAENGPFSSRKKALGKHPSLLVFEARVAAANKGLIE
jgi:hypothetical protein